MRLDDLTVRQLILMRTETHKEREKFKRGTKRHAEHALIILQITEQIKEMNKDTVNCILKSADKLSFTEYCEMLDKKREEKYRKQRKFFLKEIRKIERKIKRRKDCSDSTWALYRLNDFRRYVKKYSTLECSQLNMMKCFELGNTIQERLV